MSQLLRDVLREGDPASLGVDLRSSRPGVQSDPGHRGGDTLGTIPFLGFQHGQRSDRLPEHTRHLTCLGDRVLIVHQGEQAVLGDRFGSRSASYVPDAARCGVRTGLHTERVAGHSFYLGPDKPVLHITGWDDLVAAAQAGVLAETQWVELKAGLPARASAANLELAKDLASLSVDGGVYIVGVKDPGNHADHVVGTTDDLEKLKDRIDQVAGSVRIQPPLTVRMTPITHPTDSERHVLIVTVPASVSAPHMVDEKYWGRGGTGKRPLVDVEISRLFAERRGRRDNFRDRLERLSTDLDPLPLAQRRYGHLYVMAAPEAVLMGPPLADALRNNPLQAVLNSVSFQPTWSPALTSLRPQMGHPDGVAFASVPYDRVMEEERYLLYLLLADCGSVQLASGQGTRPYRDKIGISVNYIMEIAHQTLQLAAHLGSTYLHYGGTWSVGVHIQDLQGRLPSQALTESDMAIMHRFSPFQAVSYTRTATATTTELAEQTPSAVENLLRDLARGVGLQDYFFPYTDPSEISRKV
jgi:schlafen family protein